MILFKGRSSLITHAMKPIKRGYKLWCLADKKGYISQFEIYQEKNVSVIVDEMKDFGQHEQVLLRLTKPYWEIL